MAIIVISFDGVKDMEFEALADDRKNYPNIAEFKRHALYKGGLKTIFVSNTYPIHSTISTGKLPKDHGVISNHVNRIQKWAQLSKYINAETIWDGARKKGLSTAAFLWPVTCGAKIKWNMPEVHILKGQSQMIENLRQGSFLFQIKAFLKHGGKLKGLDAVCIDDFTSAAARDLLKSKRPDLTLIHLVAYDSLCHRFGGKSKEMDIARKSLDDSLGKISDAAGDRTVLVFSDHAHLDVNETIDLENIFGAELYEQCGGSAFFVDIKDNIENYRWFGRFLTREEMTESGYAGKAAFGIAAKPGYCFGSGQVKSNHGYPADYDDYKVFYAVRGKNYKPGAEHGGGFGDVRDITAVIKNELGG